MTDYTKIDIDFDPTQKVMRGTTFHKNLYFEVPFISEITKDLYQGGVQDGLILPRNIKNVLSLYMWEEYKRDPTVRYDAVEMYDSETQSIEQVDELSNAVIEMMMDGPTLVHCQAGLNRSSLIVGAVLVKSGMSGPDAVALIREKRSEACLCNPTFEEYILSL